MYGYIYRTTNKINQKIYIGKRKGAFEQLAAVPERKRGTGALL